MCDWVFDGPPDVYEAHTSVQEPLGIVAEVTTHPFDAGFECLVNMYALLYQT